MLKIAKWIEDLSNADGEVVFELKTFQARQEMAR
jgi:hypothetical protein